MTPIKEAFSGTRWIIGQRATVAFALLWGACGMKTALMDLAPDARGSGAAFGGSTGAGGVAVAGSGGQTSIAPAVGGSTTLSFGGSGGNGFGGSTTVSRGGSGGNVLGGSTTVSRGGSGGNGFGASGGRTGAGGSTSALRDAGVDVRVVPDAMPGSPTIDPNSGYATVSAGTVVMSGYVTSSAGGSGSSVSLIYNKDSFCASGTVGASTTYNSWANAGFNVNQPQAGGSGSTGSLALVGSTLSISYVNHAGSTLEMQLWDSVGSSYWCYYLPASTSATTKTIPLSSLNTKCWDGSGTSFVSGTSITMVQLIVPGSATTPTPFDYCFLGLTVQ
jgi:hypothetical protein